MYFDLQEPVQVLRDHGFDDMDTLLGMEEEHMRDAGMPSGHIVKLKRQDTSNSISCACHVSRPPVALSSGGCATTLRLPAVPQLLLRVKLHFRGDLQVRKPGACSGCQSITFKSVFQ